MPSPRMRSVAAVAAAAVAGTALALFTAGPALFADGPMGERVAVLAVALASYAALGVALGAAVPVAWKWSGIALAAPVIPVVAFFSEDPLSSASWAGIVFGFLLGVPAAALAGALAGARIRARR